MIKRTYGSVKDQLARAAGVTGVPTTQTATVMRKVNRAIEELMNEGNWPGIVDRYVIRVYNQNLVLPGDLDKLEAIAVECLPYEIRSSWFEFVGYGPGIQKDYIDTVDLVAIDRNETPTLRDIPYDVDAPLDYKLVVYSMVDERDADGDRPYLTIRGYDENGQWIRTEVASNDWIEGERFTLMGDTTPNYVESTGFWSNIDSIECPVTRGYVEIYAYTGSEPEQLISIISPKETDTSYRHYYLPGLPENEWTELTIRARKRYFPVTADEDYLLISNLPALENMLQALANKDAGDLEGYANHKAIAIDLMRKEAESYLGRPDPSVTVDSQDECFGQNVPLII